MTTIKGNLLSVFPKIHPEVTNFLARVINIPIVAVPLLGRKEAFAVLEATYREGQNMYPNGGKCECKYCSAARLIIEQPSASLAVLVDVEL
jgi:hypothetical protein